MAAFVDNRQFFEPAAGSVLRPIKPVPLVHHPDPPTLHPGYLSSLEEEDDDGNEMSSHSYLEEMVARSKEVEIEPSALDHRDESTADNWVERNPVMVRLTGKHPFNAEPPLERLMCHGFLTPVPLHYVRNHGPVPRATWHEWTVQVTGLVKHPRVFTMDQLLSEFPSREFPVTLVCAGNRRREQNMTRKTVGFNWGAAAVSTSVWRGVPLRAVLKQCGILGRGRGALNVCFEGAEDLPGGGGGAKYGTSIQREVAMDPSRDIILAYMQNGELLAPDHGFPVRVVIPGFIGGRMVKWLKRIIVTPRESDSYYHYRDNKVLPSHVDAELADAEGWWYKPEYTINELNLNSAITTPCNEEMLPINSWTTQRPYVLKGYAYSGGGRKVTRVEVTLDGGETWRLCELDHPEKPTPYGKYWCWCFWRLEVEVPELVAAKELAVRAWDESLNTQPEKLIWNLMGMMNNCWFRVKINVCRPQRGEIGIVFEHPTLPGNQQGGWMAKQRSSDSNTQALRKSVSSPLMVTPSKRFPLSVVKTHNSADSVWIIVHGHIYDCTQFLKDHPGGADSILINAGADCTEEFDAIHSDKAKTLLEDYWIGELLTTDGLASDSTMSSPSNSVHGSSNFSHLASVNGAMPEPTHKVALNPPEKIRCKLTKKTILSHDVRVFRFALPLEDQVLGLPVGKHVLLCATINGKLCMRAYTPTSDVDEVAYFDLLIKIYFKDVHPNFPDGGLMSQYLDSLPLNSVVEVKGPLGHIEYLGKGNFLVHGKPKSAKKLAMIAGGTGITPIYQVIQAIMKEPKHGIEMYLVYANRTEDDILLREDLDRWSRKDDRLKVWYVVKESIKDGWGYSLGHINEQILREHLPQPSDDTLALACGPPAMIQCAVRPNLERLKYDVKDSLLVF